MGSAIEKSLRRALLKGNSADPDFRLQIYEAAERALLRLEADKEISGETRETHRLDLITAIESIEGDFGSDEGAVTDGNDRPAQMQDARSLDLAERNDASDDDREFETDEDRTVLVAEPVDGRQSETDDRTPIARDTNAPDAVAETPERRSRAARTLVSFAIVLLLLFLVGAAVWIVLPLVSSVNGNQSAQMSDTSGGNDLSIAEAIRENADTTPKVDAAAEWVNVYTPQALSEFAGSDAAMEDAAAPGGEPALKLMLPGDGGYGTADGGSDSAVVSEIEMPIAGDVARQFAGKKVEGEIVVGSPDGKPRTFTLRCLFGGETACGRQRFTTSLPEENFLFHMEFPAEAVTGGQIAIDPSVGDAGKDLMFFGLKLRNAA